MSIRNNTPVTVTNKWCCALLVCAMLYISCNDTDQKTGADKQPNKDTLTEEQLHQPEHALAGLTIAQGLEVMKLANEPAIKNPTNIDVDDKGRIWVTEAYNYRPKWNGNPTNPEGDRIMILEDTNNDGQIDTAKVFYQGPEVNAPLGICVLGKKVLVSQSPYVWAFYDDNEDGKADRKEIFFKGIGGEQHDHGMHTFTAGPDGKLYFNFGNEGKTLQDKNGRTLRDQDGDEISPKKYRQGMVFRCDFDGKNVECLGQNFRNPFEVAVDSYGTLWQSDNDDDGNRGTRINYVMEYGNYGYTDEITGAGWQAPRTNQEDSIPLRHWHLNDPGEIPNLLQTGAGSPTGMIVYEGSLLPKQFYGQMIHCEPGNNVVRSYPVTKDGAGYKATISNILNDERDQWFRPADVCAAPDGSLIIADWYDPGVGGHSAGDQQKGRIYRIAPKGSVYKTSAPDYATPDGAVAALQSPNLATRYNAWTALHTMNEKAVPALEKLWHSQEDARMRARAFWVLTKLPGGEKYITEAITDSNPDLRITGLRAARELHSGVIEAVRKLTDDADRQVKRECLLALHHNKSSEAADLWVKLAKQYDAKDRWYLEALGIGADAQWNRFLDDYIKQTQNPLQSAAARDIIWRARTNENLPMLEQLATDNSVPLKERLRYFRAFDFNTTPAKTSTLLEMIANNKTNDVALNTLLVHHLTPKDVARSAVAKQALTSVLQSVYETPVYIELVTQYQQKSEAPRLWDMAMKNPGDDLGVEAMKLYIQFAGDAKIRTILKGKDTGEITSVMKVIGKVGYPQTVDMLQNIMLSDVYPVSLRKAAADNLGKSYIGEDRVVDLLQAEGIPETYIINAVESMNGGIRTGMYKKAKMYLPGARSKVSENKDITIAALLKSKGDAAAGQKIYVSYCSVCHQVNDMGKSFGPNLSSIGAKLPKEGILEAITHPSAGVGFGYETTQITLKDGTKMNGIISSKTESDIDLKFPGGSVQKFKMSDVASIKQTKESMMPVLHESMSRQDLANLVEFLSTLQKK